MTSTAGNQQPDNGQKESRWQAIRAGRSYYLTVIVLVLMAFLGVMAYLLNYWPMQFLYAMF